jgi:hypothetical protein
MHQNLRTVHFRRPISRAPATKYKISWAKSVGCASSPSSNGWIRNVLNDTGCGITKEMCRKLQGVCFWWFLTWFILRPRRWRLRVPSKCSRAFSELDPEDSTLHSHCCENLRPTLYLHFPLWSETKYGTNIALQETESRRSILLSTPSLCGNVSQSIKARLWTSCLVNDY